MAARKIMLRLIILFFMFTFGLIASVSVPASELYRYQDSDGRWVFGDKKSLSNGTDTIRANVERFVISDQRVKVAKPELVYVREELPDGKAVIKWQLDNPLPVTIQHWLSVKGEKGFFTSILAKPFETLLISPADFRLSNNIKLSNSTKVEHYYLLGNPIERPSTQLIAPPYNKNKRFLVSQGFNGQFSHTGQGNRYALDISMPVGEPVLAVKAGIVADGRDDFSIGGATNYFLDKANHVTVMHADGSYAVYAHILYGSLAVAIGQEVEVGQVIGRIGNTGYSTGPHLHFVMRYNSGSGGYSIPFKFITDQGAKTPKKGKYYSGRLKKNVSPN